MAENETVTTPKGRGARAGARASKGAPRKAKGTKSVKETRTTEVQRSAADTRADNEVVRRNALSEEIMRGRSAPADTTKVPVKLLKQYSPYNAGEVAGFPPGEAKRLIDTGYAEAHLPEDTERDRDELRKLDEQRDATISERQDAARGLREQKRQRQEAQDAARSAPPARGAKKKGARKTKK